MLKNTMLVIGSLLMISLIGCGDDTDDKNEKSHFTYYELLGGSKFEDVQAPTVAENGESIVFVAGNKGDYRIYVSQLNNNGFTPINPVVTFNSKVSFKGKSYKIVSFANPSDHTTFEDYNSPIVQDNIVTIAGMIQEEDSNSEPVSAAFYAKGSESSWEISIISLQGDTPNDYGIKNSQDIGDWYFVSFDSPYISTNNRHPSFFSLHFSNIDGCQLLAISY